MARQKEGIVRFGFFFILGTLSSVLFLAIFSSFAFAEDPDVDFSVETSITEQGYAEVVVFVDAPLSAETQKLIDQQEFLSGMDTIALKKILADKKKAIQKGQQKIFREMNIEALPEESLSDYALTSANVDFFLEDRYTYVNAFSGILTEEGYQKLLREPSVIGIYANEELKLSLDTAVPFVGGDFVQSLSLNGTAINGSGIGICVIDTGVDAEHKDLKGKIVDEYCYCSIKTASTPGCCPNGLLEDTSAKDDNGHGSAVIGTIVSQDSTYGGIAPGAQVMVVKTFNSTGSSTTADIISGISKCLEKASAYNIKVFSFSFGGNTYSSGCDTDSLASVANELVEMGFFVAAASGNNGDGKNGDTTKINSPACGSKVVAVGAVYDSSSSVPDTIPSFSNANSVLDILAPGVNICTTTIKSGGAGSCNAKTSISTSGDAALEGNNKYGTYSGTSLSVPFVAGAAALVAQYKKEEANTVLDPTTIASYLTTYGQPVLDPRNGLVFPRLDVKNTLLHIDAEAPTVSFIAPTPEDNVPTGTHEVTVSVLASDAVNEVVLCKLFFNGTNTTMTMNGTESTVTCSLSLSFSGTEPFVAYAMDANGNVGATEERMLRFDNAAPVVEEYSPTTQTVELLVPENMSFSVTATDSDGDALSYSWLLNGALVSSTNTFIFDATFWGEGVHTLLSLISDSFENASIAWNITVLQPQTPSVSVVLEPAVAYRIDTLFCNYTYADPNNDAENGTSISWHINGEEDSQFQNLSVINGSIFSVDDTVQCSVTPSDGTNFGAPIFSGTVAIANYAPDLAVSDDISVQETEPVVLSYSVSDRESDAVTVSINDVRFVLDGDSYVMTTTLNSSETFTVLFTATDDYDTVSAPVTVTILDARDSDNDGIPDFTDDDDDDDGIPDSIDRIFGSPERVITNLASFGILVNGTADLNQSFEGELPVAFTSSNETIATFSFNFSEALLDIFSLNLSSENQSNGNMVITHLNLSSTKTVFVPDTNTTTTAVCIQDVEHPSLESMSASCNGTQEYLVACNGTNSSGYTCIDLGSVLEISGLTHSAVVQKCVDADGDGYGTGCALGSDCDDTRSGVHSGATEIADNGIDEDCSGADTTSPAAAPVEEEVVKKPTGGAGGGGGGGDGPSSDSAGEGTSEGTSESGATSSATASESSAAASSQTGESDSVSSAETAASGTETAPQDSPQKTSFFSITGAAVTDLFTGNWNRATALLLSSVLVGGIFLGFGTYVVVRFRKKETKKVQELGSEAKAAIFDVYEGIKELFKR